jgi:exonuclease III
MANVCKMISYNCRSIKRAIDGVRLLCGRADIVALQETWLLPFDLPFLSSVNSEFNWTGKPAVDVSAGLLKGRPYGGVGILWRRNAFEKASVIECASDRISGVKLTSRGKAFLIFSVYMPTDSRDNLTVFTDCLSALSASIAENSDVQAVYVLGDFNAHPSECFYGELMDFCAEQMWICADIKKLGVTSGSYTYISDIHGCTRWLDHCVVTQCGWDTIRNISILHDIFWSDHFPLCIECDIDILKAVNNIPYSHVNRKVIWRDRSVDQIDEYQYECNERLKNIDFPSILSDCCDQTCNNVDHFAILDEMYSKIIGTLTDASMKTHTSKKRRKGGYIAGWNKHVADVHREARLHFQMWELVGKPTRGRMYDLMSNSKKAFKSKLKWCQNKQEQLKMDSLALAHNDMNFKSFWKGTKSLDIKPGLPVSVEDQVGHKDIAELFREHFNVRSMTQSQPDARTHDGVTVGAGRSFSFTAKDVAEVIRKMRRGKSPGHDGLSIEHFRYAGVHMPRVLAMFMNLCLCHSYLPASFMKTIVVPVVKNRTGDLSDKNNYRPISLATTTAKILDSMLNSLLEKHLKLQDAQFGFRAGLSTESAILSLKHTVGYYTARKTPIYACFLDLSKAFDRVNYNILWRKLGETGMPSECVKIFEYWYLHQSNQVRWADEMSAEYKLECGVRQGGITSPKLFNLYMDELIAGLSSMHAGCYIDGVSVNNISYADDMVLLAPAVGALEQLLSLCEAYADSHGLVYNVAKSEVMVFKAGKIKPCRVPRIMLNGVPLKVVERFKYLGHIITSNLNDDQDIERERRALAVRGNMLARRFARCSTEVKITLFKAYCQSFYSSSLWVRYTKRAYSALKVQYNNAFRMLLGLPSRCSASGMFCEARTDGFPAIMRKRIVSLLGRVRQSSNSILNVIADKYDCPIFMYWIKQVKGVAYFLD